MKSIFGGFPYPTSTVGSFSQPDELRKARVRLRGGEISEEAYAVIVRKHIQIWMDFQKSIGITLPVGGEFAREDMAAYFGISFGGKLLDFVPSYENRRYRPVEYSEEINFRGSPSVENFLFVQSLSHRPIKETITGPATLADWALIRNRSYYFDRAKFRLDLARALRIEIEALIRWGVRVLQIDEPALTTKMKVFPMDLDAIYKTIAGLEEKVYLILHICYSDFNALDAAFPHILQLPFHQIHMEMANRNYSLLKLIEKHGFAGKDIGLGVVDVHTDRVESVDEIVSGVKKARQFFKPEEIWLTPDCGLKERGDEIAKAKLLVMAEAARVCREQSI